MEDPLLFAQLQEAAAQDINRYLHCLWKKVECRLAKQSKVIQHRCKLVLKAVECKLVKHSNGAQSSCKSVLKTIRCKLIKHSKGVQRSGKSILSKKEARNTDPIKPPKTTAIFVVAEGTVEVVAPLVIYSNCGSWETFSPSHDVPTDGLLSQCRCYANDPESYFKTEQSSSPWCFGNMHDEQLAVKSFSYESLSETITGCSSSIYNSSSHSIADEKTLASDYFACRSPCHFLSPKKKRTVVENEILFPSRENFSHTSSLSSSSFSY